MSISAPVINSGRAAEKKQQIEPSIQLGVLTLVVVCTVFLAVLLASPGDDTVIIWFEDVINTVIIGALGVWCVADALWSRSAATTDNSSRCWVSVYLGMSAILYAIGNGVRMNFDLVLHEPTGAPSWADTGHMAAYPIMLMGLLRLPIRPLPSASRSQIVLDAVMSMTVFATIAWYYLMAPALSRDLTGAASGLVQAAYPLWDLLLIASLLVLSEYSEDPRMRRTMRMIGFGITFLVIADIMHRYVMIHYGARVGMVTDIGWPAGFGMICFAGLFARRDVTDEYAATAHVHVGKEAVSFEKPRRLTAQSFLPYALTPVLIALTVSVLLHHEMRLMAGGVYLGCCVLMTLILVRQVTAILDSNELRHDLSEAYHNLQTVHEALETKTRSLATATSKIDGMAAVDPMTGLANHRKFQERLRDELSNCQASKSPCSILMVDIDSFKPYNDAFGHPSGDEVLKIVARLTRDAVRPSDLAARYGGEEFGVILPGADARIAFQVAERIRQKIEKYEFPYRKISVSVGVSGLPGGTAADPEFWIEDAEAALCRAKYGGRNNTVVSEIDDAEATLRPAR